jgi:hypothetical protein
MAGSTMDGTISDNPPHACMPLLAQTDLGQVTVEPLAACVFLMRHPLLLTTFAYLKVSSCIITIITIVVVFVVIVPVLRRLR